MTKFAKTIIRLLPMAGLLTGLAACGGSKDTAPGDHGEDIDTLRVVTLYGPTSFFEYRGELMGLDYENVKRFAEDEGMVLEIQPVGSISELVETLREGKAHLAAYPVPSIDEYDDALIYCGPMEVTRQVLVQKAGDNKVADVTQLVGKDIFVEKDSKYLYRLQNLNDEIGGGINVITLPGDTIFSDDLLRMVKNGEIDFTVTDTRTASIFGNSFPTLDTSLSLSADQASSWAVAPGLDSLAVKIDRWENRTHSSEFVKEIYRRYYESSVSEEDLNLQNFKKLKKANGVSTYDEYFKRHAPTSGFDWELLAAIAFCESRYNTDVESRFGAKGLMQVMPETARAVGVDPGSLNSPDQNVKAAAKILSRLDKSFANRIENPEERMKFVVAAYNSGLGHILDAMALAEKIGLDPQKWYANVSVTTLLKSSPEYYNDPVVKHGFFRGRETVDFVDNVTGIYHYLKGF